MSYLITCKDTPEYKLDKMSQAAVNPYVRQKLLLYINKHLRTWT